LISGIRHFARRLNRMYCQNRIFFIAPAAAAAVGVQLSTSAEPAAGPSALLAFASSRPRGLALPVWESPAILRHPASPLDLAPVWDTVS